MCTLPILPGAESGYLLGHNRDESLRRPPGLPPAKGRHDGRSFLAPRDPQAGGSWIGVNDGGITFALLNAAHADPGRLAAEPPSRGRLLDGVIALTAPEEVERVLAADPLMPATKGFHLVMVAPGSGQRAARAFRFRWNGERLERDAHALPVLFVSSGFDQAGAERARGRVWRASLEAGRVHDAATLRAWLAGHQPERGILSACMHGGVAATVSRTLVEVAGDRARMEYHGGAPCDPAAPESEIALPIEPVSQ